MVTKFCRKCQTEKPIEEFWNNKSAKDGKTWSCIPCSKASTKAWYDRESSKAKIRATGRAWRFANPERVKENKRNFRENNPDSARASVKKCWDENYEKYKITGWRHWLKKKYGLTEERYYDLLEKQDFGCAICGVSEPDSKRKRFCVDHCHDSKIVRGLLCFSCNVTLGNMQDRIDLLEKAIQYLQKFPKPEKDWMNED